ncbi:MAG: carboxylate--amine ligase [Alphaproteobacteria bacterium]|nr:carboxylate--amine ligase [Alphaproteobacteria bacterium]
MRDLGRHGHAVIGIGRDSNALAGTSRYCTAHFVRDVGEDALITQIGQLADQFHASYLLAISESDLTLINRHRDSLQQFLTPLTPTADALAKVLDKPTCQSIAGEVGLSYPVTYSPRSVTDLAGMTNLPFPAVLKWADPNEVAPALAAAGLELEKARIVLNRAELDEYIARFEPIGQLPMIQEYCHGHGIGHMFLARDGEILFEFQHERIHEWPPEGGVSALCRSMPLEEEVEARRQSRKLINHLRWTGVAMVEYRFDPDRKTWKFLEINGRFWGSLPLAVAVNVPFASSLVSAIGENQKIPNFQQNYPNRFCMFWIPETKRLMRILFRPKLISDPHFRVRPFAELASYLSYLLRPSTQFYVFTRDDPRPFFRDMMSVGKKVINGLLRR